MGKFLKTVFTDKGKQILFGSGNVTYTKAELYSQDTSNLTSDEIKALTSLSGVLLSTGAGVTSESKNTVSVHAVFSNRGLTDDISFKTVGWFAKAGNGAETLIAVSPLDGSKTLPAGAPDLSNNAIDLTLNISIGDATTVNVSIIPSDVVKPTDLENLRTLLAGKIDTKADKATVESDLATKANSVDLNKTNAEVAKKADSENVVTQLDTKADKTDVASSVKQLQDSIATKADAKTVNDAISKIDFTPYAKMVDVYSKAELDKKLLALSTDTDGKVNADQVATMIEGKANKTDVDAKIKAVTDLANTKVDASDVYTKKTVDDAFSTRDSNITNAANLAKQASQNIDSTLVNSYFRKQGMDANGNLVEIKSTGVKVNSGGYAFDIWNNDWTASKLKEIINQVASLNSSWQVRSYSNAVNLNDLWTAWGISYLINSNNTNTPSFISDKRGTLFTFSFDGNGKWQLFAGCIKGLAYRSYLNDGDTWHKLADDTDISDLQSKIANAQNTATQANNNANTRLPLTGGAMNSNAEISFNNDAVGKQGGLTWNGSTDSAKIYGDVTAQDNLDLAFDLGDDGSNHFSFRRNGSETSAITSDGHYTGTVDWGHVNSRPAITPIVSGSAGDNLFAYKDNQLRLYPGNGLNCQNLPPAQNKQWFTVQYVFENPNGDGVAIYRSPAPEMWISGNNGGTYGTWHKIATGDDITDLRNQIQQLRENQFETQTFTDANAAANWEAQKPGKRLAIVNR